MTKISKEGRRKFRDKVLEQLTVHKTLSISQICDSYPLISPYDVLDTVAQLCRRNKIKPAESCSMGYDGVTQCQFQKVESI